MPYRKRLGFFKKSANSDPELFLLFNEVQKIRYSSSEKDWTDPHYYRKLQLLETKAKNRIDKLLRAGKLKTGDDFYRAAFIYHHGSNYRSYAQAVALAAVSNILGESWGRNLYAVALDRFLISLGLPQHFGTQFEKKSDKWLILPIDPHTTDRERKIYNVESLNKLKSRIDKMNSR